MDDKGYSRIPSALFDWITFLARSLPIRSAPTFIELLIGAMLTSSGFVVQTGLSITLTRHWTSYFKWLQHGKWSWLALARQLARLIVHWFPDTPCFLAIDDTVNFRSSTKAPGCRIHHQHSRKPNRPDFVRGQGWVCLAAVVGSDRHHHAIPLLARLTRASSNTTKLTMANTLLRGVRGIFSNVTLLVDSWFMRAALILPALEAGHAVIGQVRKDTALYLTPLPRQPGKRGRPRRYGDKLTPSKIAKLPESEAVLWLYGKNQTVRYQSTISMARFLGGRLVRVVWVRFVNDKGVVSQPRLLLATNPHLHPEAIILHYGRRWSIESMFGQLKNGWGFQETWQQTRQVLHRWVHILFAAFALPLLLSLRGGDQVRQLANFAPWRVNTTVTAGLIRMGLQKYFTNIRARDWWNPKSRIFAPPNEDVPATLAPILPKAA